MGQSRPASRRRRRFSLSASSARLRCPATAAAAGATITSANGSRAGPAHGRRSAATAASGPRQHRRA
eukprot:11212126-Lingulodinium_polyedra.AAC.1